MPTSRQRRTCTGFSAAVNALCHHILLLYCQLLLKRDLCCCCHSQILSVLKVSLGKCQKAQIREPEARMSYSDIVWPLNRSRRLPQYFLQQLLKFCLSSISCLCWCFQRLWLNLTCLSFFFFPVHNVTISLNPHLLPKHQFPPGSGHMFRGGFIAL